MVSAHVSGSSGPGSSPGRGHCGCVLWQDTHSHSASLHPSSQMSAGEFTTGGSPSLDLHPFQGGRRNTPSRSYYRNRNKLRPPVSLAD